VNLWRSTRGKKILSALLQIGWKIKRRRGSHSVLGREGYPDYVWALRDGEEVGPKMLARISKKTGLKPEDL